VEKNKESQKKVRFALFSVIDSATISSFGFFFKKKTSHVNDA